MNNRIKFDDASAAFLVLFLLAEFFFTNGILLFCGFVLFYFLFYNLQQAYKPSVFTIILIYHFLQITAAIWQSNYLGVDINFRSDHMIYAIVVCYVGLLMLFSPIIYYQNRIPVIKLSDLKRHAVRLSTDKAMRMYVISFFGMNALWVVASFVPSLIQIFFSLANIKWLFFLVFGLLAIIKNERKQFLYLFCGLEFALGFFSYFSEFKTIIFYIMFLALIFLTSIRFNKLIVVVVGLAAVFFAGVFWTSIKDEYRGFLNQGSNSQTVQVEQSQALDKLLELSRDQNSSSFEESIDAFLDRLQYTFHMAKTMERVPSIIPYQDGANWTKTLRFVLTPRILDPNKGKYDASLKATQYTGIGYSGASRGTSISLGYFADCYIDFGYVGMMVPLLLIGFIFGSSYFYFVKHSSNNYIFNFAVVGAIYMTFFAFESDNIFFVGRLYVNLVVFFMLKIFVFPALHNYLKVPQSPIPNTG